MADLKTTYMGLELKNPLVVASSSLTSTVKKVQECEKAGAGAVVLKSLFEEQINSDREKLIGDMNPFVHADASDFLSKMGANYYLDNYLTLLEEAKQAVSIPVIASINCVNPGVWLDYAERFENVGADAIELNAFIMPANAKVSADHIEKTYLSIIKKIKKRIKIPVALKIGPHFTAMASIMQSFAREGADGLVLFNRFYKPDVNIEKEKIVPAKIYSVPQEMALSLRWIALMSGELDLDMAATTGIYDGEAVVKQLLVGAKVTQLCSTLYKNGLEVIPQILEFVEDWMTRHNYSKISDFNGKLCQENSERPEIYERSQYIKAIVGIS